MVPPTSPATNDWAAIYAEHGWAMRTTAIAKLGGPGKEILGKSADDIVGDVLAEVMNRGLPLTTNLRGYLTTAVRNRICDLIDRSRHEAPDEHASNKAISANDIETSLEQDELVHHALAGLDQLPERERYAVVERVMKCRSARDVGAELGVSGQRVSQLVNAGVARLRVLPAFTELLSVDRSPPGPHATGTP